MVYYVVGCRVDCRVVLFVNVVVGGYFYLKFVYVVVWVGKYVVY